MNRRTYLRSLVGSTLSLAGGSLLLPRPSRADDTFPISLANQLITGGMPIYYDGQANQVMAEHHDYHQSPLNAAYGVFFSNGLTPGFAAVIQQVISASSGDADNSIWWLYQGCQQLGLSVSSDFITNLVYVPDHNGLSQMVGSDLSGLQNYFTSNLYNFVQEAYGLGYCSYKHRRRSRVILRQVDDDNSPPSTAAMAAGAGATAAAGGVLVAASNNVAGVLGTGAAAQFTATILLAGGVTLGIGAAAIVGYAIYQAYFQSKQLFGPHPQTCPDGSPLPQSGLLGDCTPYEDGARIVKPIKRMVI